MTVLERVRKVADGDWKYERDFQIYCFPELCAIAEAAEKISQDLAIDGELRKILDDALDALDKKAGER